MRKPLLFSLSLVLVLLVATGVALAAPRLFDKGGFSVPITWDAEPGSLPTLPSIGRAESPLTAWTSINVETTDAFSITVKSIFGLTLLDSSGQDTQMFDLQENSDPLILVYQGQPANILLFGKEIAVQTISADDTLIRFETENALIPSGSMYHTDSVSIVPGSGAKAAMVCATWGGIASLQVSFVDHSPQKQLGFADLSPDRPCAPILGRVNRPFSAVVTPSGDVQLYDLNLR
jgi:hypothetical protein